MEVKKFEAMTIQDAIKLVRKEFGKDAVILSTKEKPFAPGMPSKGSTFEVVAARGMTSSPLTSSNVLPPQEAARAQPFEFKKMRTREEPTVVKNDTVPSPSLSRLNQSTVQAAKALSAAMTPQQAQQRAPQTLQPQPGATSRAVTQPTRERLVDFDDGQQGLELQDLREELQRVRKEIETLPHLDVGEQVQEIKVLLHELMKDGGRRETQTGTARYNDFITDLGVKLRTAGVAESFVSELMATLAAQAVPKAADGGDMTGDKLKEWYLNQAIRMIFRQISVTGNWRNEPGQQKLICLVGPTGVGKTTSIAKLAARLKLSDKKKVALVSMDAFRIAAADQLRVYAKILDCPFVEATEEKELVDFVHKQHDADFILIDTAGRSFRALAQMDQLKQLQKVDLPLHFHLVLSASMKQRDMDENIKAFKPLTLESILFTKLDESWSFGEILNCTVKSKIPLSYFTTGQKVPEDLEIATKERVVERLFRL